MPAVATAGRDQNQEIRTQARFPTRMTQTQASQHCLLPSRVCTNRKLESKAELEFEPKHSKTGCRYPNGIKCLPRGHSSTVSPTLGNIYAQQAYSHRRPTYTRTHTARHTVGTEEMFVYQWIINLKKKEKGGSLLLTPQTSHENLEGY